MRRSHPTKRTMLRAAAFLVLTGVSLAGACQKFASSEIGFGLGSSCNTDSDCQAAKCVDGLCAIPCDANKCPKGMVCADTLCQLPVSAGFIYPGEVEQEPFTQSVEIGRSTLPTAAPYLTSTFVEDKWLESDISDAAASYDAQGFKVIIGASPAYGSTLLQFAQNHPDIQLFVLGARVARQNLTPFDARTYQAYFLAGIAAGHTSKSHRIGMVGSVYSPSVVASINAYALGARSVAPETIVELRWLGDTHDRSSSGGNTLERTLTQALMTDGADVIAHTLDNNIPVIIVDQDGPDGTFAIGANVRTACQGQVAPNKCVGSVFYNWGPLLASLVDGYHRQDVPGSVLASIQATSLDSPVGFIVDDGLPNSQILSQEIDGVRSTIAGDQGVSRVFQGPIKSTGQCGDTAADALCVPEGGRLDDAGLASMCWLVDGIVEKDGTNVDVPAKVPEEQDCTPPMK